MIELALAFTDRDGSYAQHAAVVLKSVFFKTASQVNVHILHDETLTEDNKLKLSQLVSSHRHKINFYLVALPSDMAEVMANIPWLNIWTSGSMYRLLLPSLINADKVIYLDCDVFVNIDIEELWNIPLPGSYLAAVRDPGIMGIRDTVLSQGLNPDNYFNSGVIVFELNNIRQKHGSYEEMLNFLRSYPGSTLPDQDILNHNFGGNYMPLEERFNSFCTNTADFDLNNKIVHFAGEIKWWNPTSPYFHLYESLFNETPWIKPVEPSFDHMEPTEPPGDHAEPDESPVEPVRAKRTVRTIRSRRMMRRTRSKRIVKTVRSRRIVRSARSKSNVKTVRFRRSSRSVQRRISTQKSSFKGRGLKPKYR